MSRKSKREEEKVKSKILSKIIIVAIFLGLIFFVLKFAPNYRNMQILDRTNLVINNSNVTSDLKQNVIRKDGIIYISKEDIKNFFDSNIYYEQGTNQIITTSENQIASMLIGKKHMKNNGSEMQMSGCVFQENDIYYIPLSDLKNVYNIEINYIESSDTITVDTKSREKIVADTRKNNGVKSYPTFFSKDVDKIKKGETVIFTGKKQGNWIEIRTDTGKLGYVKKDTLINEYTVRENIKQEKQIEKNVSMVWDYYSEYVNAPDRTGTNIKGINVFSPSFFSLVDEGKGEIKDNAGEEGKKYVKWAHSNGDKVWPILSNNSYIQTTSEIMKDYNLRQTLIENIVSLVLKYDLDGINVDFEYMYEEDKNLFSRFIIELKPRLAEIGAVLSVDVTAPDGSPEWSLCYDRNLIGSVADYIVFMAYDQNGISSPVEGTTAGYDWVKANIEKFLGQEGVEAEKIILGIPFYTRVWEESNGKIETSAIDMKSIEKIVPNEASKTWNDDLKQYYIEFMKDGVKNKIWAEDEESIKAKMSLISEYNLAGAAYWEKDREPDSIWNIISEILQVE